MTGTSEVSSEDLEARARRAMNEGHYDRPSPDNVAELTARLLEHSPDNEVALNLRRDASRRLRIEGETAQQQGFGDEARGLFQRALDLHPQNREALQALAALERSHTPDEAHGGDRVRVVPESVQIGDTVTLIAILENEVPGEIPPRFVISRAGTRRALIAVMGADRRTWVASYVARTRGDYGVSFESEDHEPMAGDFNVIRRLASRPRAVQERQQQPAQPAPRPAPAVRESNGIDWSLPGEQRQGGTTSRPAPPDLLEQHSGEPTTL